MKEVEWITNTDLIESNLKHIQFELSLESPSYFRIAIEAHNALLRAMVETVRGGSNFFIDKRLDKERTFTFQIGGKSPIMIKKERVAECRNAWRFSNPVPVHPDSENENGLAQSQGSPEEFLIGFYDLLAMIQCDYFMQYFSGAATISILDDDLAELDWLHQEVRNEYEHFIPKSYGAPCNELICASILCLDICSKLLVDSANIYLLGQEDRFSNSLRAITARLRDNSL